MLLDDSRRYIERAVASGVDAHLDVWQGLAHGFAGSVGKLKAATQALDSLGKFLAERLSCPGCAASLIRRRTWRRGRALCRSMPP